MRFTHAFQAAPQCVPSRAALMTGRSPVAARMGRFTSPLPPDVVSLPELLREKAGYYTGICRRTFHLDGSPRLQGVSAEIMDRHQLRTFAKRVDYLDVSGPGQTTAKVDAFLDRRPASKPFFLWVNFNDPHHVWDSNAIPEPHDRSKINVPKHLPDLPGVRDDMGRYLDEISRMDGEFQSVLDILKKRGLEQNTLVVFMGDNGMAFPHGKGSLYDPGLRVPLLDTVAGDLISGEDITPTFLDAAGVAPVKQMTGRSFLGRLTGGDYSSRQYIFGARLVHGSATFDETTKANTLDFSRCVRSAKWKLIYNCTPNMEYWPVDSGNDPGWKEILAAHRDGKLAPEHERAYFKRPRPVYELYDLENDPSELTNVAQKSELAGTLREMKIALQEKMMVDYDWLPLPLVE
jgi:arylsulfatase A-like enzyme